MGGAHQASSVLAAPLARDHSESTCRWWDKTCTIVENQIHDKYLVKVDGSGRVTHRNRRFLRSFKPAMQTSLLLRIKRDASVSRPQVSSPPATSAHGARQPQDDVHEHDDQRDVHEGKMWSKIRK